MQPRPGTPSNASSSDDGGFLPHRSRGFINNNNSNNNRASWRRPLVGYPSQLSLRSDATGQSATTPMAYFVENLHYPLQNHHHHQSSAIHYVPHQVSATALYQNQKFQSSSPTNSISGLLLSPWTPPMHFSDLSSVRYTSSGERSFPTPPGFMQLRSVHERYSQELPPLRAIHEEHQAGFVPVEPSLCMDDSSPRPLMRPSRSGRLLTTKHARLARSAPELDHLDRSPESRSSSSGFGSKNTSSQQNHSSHSGSTFMDWRLPPYRPPPPAPLLPPPPPPLIKYWLELASSSPSNSDHLHKAVDVGSVDGHYEFDPRTPTPTPSIPSGSRGDGIDVVDSAGSTGIISRKSGFAVSRNNRYDNIDARVQAMKEEFNEFRKRQANRRRGHELESAC